jgi:hypothetical protein
MDATVKAAMLKSSQAMALNPPVSTPLTPRAGALRRTRSTESLGSPKQARYSMETDKSQQPHSAAVTSNLLSSRPALHLPTGHSRGVSFDVPRSFSRSQIHLAGEVALSKITKDKGSSLANDISPTKFFSILSGTSSTQLEVENVKKLRLLLRNESAR